ncbi:MAG: RRXRR domain-containing protein [Deltaproteobacteria bacterium]|nr:RRXRR domain-containing protein [Deltaproteobacteria bacterium]
MDPGGKVTGAALVRVTAPETEGSGPEAVLIASFGLENRGDPVKRNMTRRKGCRYRRRSANLSCRKASFPQRTREKGRLPLYLPRRVEVVGNFAARILRLAPLPGFPADTARFDAQRKRNPDISCVEYRQGELQCYEVLQYLREREGGKCAYCEKMAGPWKRAT